MKQPTAKDIARWRRRARKVFALRILNDGRDWDRQAELAIDLARDVLRVLDPAEYRRPR